MKKLGSYLMLLFVFSLISSTQLYAQVTSTNSTDVSISFGNSKYSFTLENGTESIKISPSGNYLRVLTFQLDSDDPLLNFSMPFAIVRISLSADIDGDGDIEMKLKDERAVITPSGLVKIIYHYNGKNNTK